MVLCLLGGMKYINQPVHCFDMRWWLGQEPMACYLASTYAQSQSVRVFLPLESQKWSFW